MSLNFLFILACGLSLQDVGSHVSSSVSYPRVTLIKDFFSPSILVGFITFICTSPLGWVLADSSSRYFFKYDLWMSNFQIAHTSICSIDMSTLLFWFYLTGIFFPGFEHRLLKHPHWSHALSSIFSAFIYIYSLLFMCEDIVQHDFHYIFL